MKNDLKHKLYMGFRGFMMRIPPLLSDKARKKGERGVKANAACLSKEERRVHHFIVMKMAVVKDPITAELVAYELGMPNDRVLEIIDKLGLSLRKKYEYPKQALVINAFWRFNIIDSFFRDC